MHSLRPELPRVGGPKVPRRKETPRRSAGRNDQNTKLHQFLARIEVVKARGVPIDSLSLLGMRRYVGSVVEFAPLSLRIGRIARRAIACHNPTMLARAVQPSWIFIRLEWTRHGVNSENPELLIENRYRRAERASNYIPPPLQYEPETWQSTLRCRA